VELYTNPPSEATVVCVDELGPVSPRTFPPAPGWSPDGHRIKAPVEYSRGPDKVWIFGALRVEDGKSLTFTSRSRNSKSYLKLLKKIERAITRGLIYLIADNLKIHDSALVREWLEGHPRIAHAFIPKGAAWGSTSSRAGGVFPDDRPLPEGALRIVTRSTWRGESPPGN
jgi:DDE superfamily endonuclease